MGARREVRYAGCMVLWMALLSTLGPWVSAEACSADEAKPRPCELHGRVKFVEAFADYKIELVTAFPDARVKLVESFPDRPGRWKVVESFPDFTVQIVESFSDFKVQVVESFPGCR